MVITAKPLETCLVLSLAKKTRVTFPNGLNSSCKSVSVASSGRLLTLTLKSSLLRVFPKSTFFPAVLNYFFFGQKLHQNFISSITFLCATDFGSLTFSTLNTLVI
ncbi:hypothetical protein BpHYR1_024619 [Brachionus plicatilis]|uniref:Uncharacterized protein n=1 Tax=Brachionus plicatilis TaxID=10195 RepID=A0A3M7SRE9_BRAPC|nr:hypothetical protein BpHYR1_024619 [Brachionus plicatilis]